MADSGTSFCRQSRPEAIHRTVCLGAGSKAAGRAAPNRVQRLQTAFGSHRNWSSNGGHVTTMAKIPVPKEPFELEENDPGNGT